MSLKRVCDETAKEPLWTKASGKSMESAPSIKIDRGGFQIKQN